MKVIALIRTSTDKQEVESQKREVISLCLSDGYRAEDIEVIGCAGASAIKLDAQYLRNINNVYARVDSGEIEAVYAWGIDRIGRDEEILMQFKNRLIKNKVQLVIKQPSLRLMNDDGSVNAGVEVAFSIFATMAKQEMEQKKARFRRGKERNALNGKFNGGVVPFGYSLDDKSYYILHPVDSESVKLAFELMSSDRYTISTLTEELRSRGIMYNGRLITYQFVTTILKNTAYIGYRNKYAFNKVYPRIVSDDIFYKVKQILSKNNSTKGKATRHYDFAALLIKCPDCGRNYIAHHGKYVCSAFNSPSIRRVMGQKICHNNLMIHIGHLDGILWSISLRLYYKHLQGLTETEKQKIIESITLLETKLTEADRQLNELADKLDRIEDIYIETGNKAKYEKGKNKIEEERRSIVDSKTRYNEEKASLYALLDKKPDEMNKWSSDNFIVSQMKYEGTEKQMYDLVHTYIKAVEIERAEFPNAVCNSYIIVNGRPLKKDYKLAGRRAVKVRIITYENHVVELFYVPNFRWADVKCFTVSDGIAVPFDYEPIIRKDGYVTTESTTRSVNFIKAVAKAIETTDKNVFFSDILPGIIAGEDIADMREVRETFDVLHNLRDMRIMLTTISACAKYFDVQLDFDKILANLRL